MKTVVVVLVGLCFPLIVKGSNAHYTGGKYWIYQLKPTETTFNPKGIVRSRFVPQPPLMFCGEFGTKLGTIVKFPEGPRNGLDKIRFRFREDIHVILFSEREKLVKGFPSHTGKNAHSALYPNSVVIGDNETYQVPLFTNKGFFVWEKNDFVQKDPAGFELPTFETYLQTE